MIQERNIGNGEKERTVKAFITIVCEDASLFR